MVDVEEETGGGCAWLVFEEEEDKNRRVWLGIVVRTPPRKKDEVYGVRNRVDRLHKQVMERSVDASAEPIIAPVFPRCCSGWQGQ